jgi:hypothetical protein
LNSLPAQRRSSQHARGESPDKEVGFRSFGDA